MYRVGAGGVEPPEPEDYGFTGRVVRRVRAPLETVPGVAPGSHGLQPRVRNCLHRLAPYCEPQRGIEPRSSAYKAVALAVELQGRGVTGGARTRTDGFTNRHAAVTLQSPRMLRAFGGTRTHTTRGLNPVPLPLGYEGLTRVSGRTRTYNFQILNLAPLPVGPRRLACHLHGSNVRPPEFQPGALTC